MVETRKEYLELGDGRLYYEVAGVGETVVLSHAGFLDNRMFDDVWEPLARQFQVVRYDMRGFGKSSPVNGPICRRRDLAELLKHLNITRAHLVGCSIGGEICLDMALEQPDLVSSLTLVDSTPGGFEMMGEPPRYLMEMFEVIQKGESEYASDLQIRIWLDGSFRDPEQVDQKLREKAQVMNRIPVRQNTFMLADMQPDQPLNPPAVTRLETVACPTLIIAGSLDHPEVLRAADEMVARIPNATKAIIEGGGHVPGYEQPEKFHSILVEFLDSVSSRNI